MALNQNLSLKEDLLSSFEVLLEKLKESDLLALKLILDDGAVKETLKGVEELELANNSVAVVEGLSQHGGEATLQLLDALAEVEEIVVKFASLNVHDVIVDLHEVLNDDFEFVENLSEGLAHGSTLGVTDFDFLELLELLDSASQVHDVHAAFGESVKADEESVGGDLPLVLALGLVVEVGILEPGAHVQGQCELLVGLSSVLILDSVEDFLAINKSAALGNDGVADLSNENDKASRGVVVLGVGPDEEDGVHDGHKELSNLVGLIAGADELAEEVLEGAEILVVLVGLFLGNLNFLLQLGEGGGVGALVLFKELEDLLDALTVELSADLVEVLALVFPELKLSHGVGVLAVLKGVFGVLLEHVLDLLLPVDDGSLKNVGLVLGASALGRGHIIWGQRE